MQAANQCALKNIQKIAELNALRAEGKELSILEDNLVLLQDHPQGYNKIQDCFKTKNFLQWSNCPNLMYTELNQFMVMVQSGL